MLLSTGKKTHYVIIFILIITRFLLGQEPAYPAVAATDSTAIPDSLKKEIHFAEHKHHFSDLIHLPFNGMADLMRTNNDIQIFDFMELGRPRFIAPLNMYPQQMNVFIDGLRMNDHITNMYNTRLISGDHIKTIATMDHDSSFAAFGGVGKDIFISRRFIDDKDAYTRLKFYEGDFQYTDLDIFFASRYSSDFSLQLFGFNKGYAGSGFNNAHTGVNYNGELRYKLSPKLDGLFTFRLNHERAGMQNIKPTFTDYTYSANDVEYGMRLYFKPDSTMKNPFILGFLSRNGRHEHKAGRSFDVKDRSDDYTFYMQKPVSYKKHNLSATFSIDNHRMWGSAFTDNLTDNRFALDIRDVFNPDLQNKFNMLLNLEQMNSYNPQLSTSLGWQTRYNNFQTELKGTYQNRYPAALERFYSYKSYNGNPDLASENINDLTLAQSWKPFSNFLVRGDIGFTHIKDEILFSNNTFINGKDRNFSYLKGLSSLQLGPLNISAGGRLLSADHYISPKKAAWGELNYHDIWFNGVIIIDVAGHINWYDTHDQILYNPIVQRFYAGTGENPSYSIVGLKIVLTVSDAELFLEMDNLLKEKMVIIDGYDNDLRQVRFGVNWVMWN
ncbi:MAG: hypothetical protein KDF60_13680 [Calditrichaeota bacterium]|nr:hypothetical protein [Calditrichota bacterium]